MKIREAFDQWNNGNSIYWIRVVTDSIERIEKILAKDAGTTAEIERVKPEPKEGEAKVAFQNPCGPTAEEKHSTGDSDTGCLPGLPVESQDAVSPAVSFLKRTANYDGRIVTTNDLTELQICEAQRDKRMYVDSDGLGYVVLPWDLSTKKDKQREVSLLKELQELAVGVGWNPEASLSGIADDALGRIADLEKQLSESYATNQKQAAEIEALTANAITPEQKEILEAWKMDWEAVLKTTSILEWIKNPQATMLAAYRAMKPKPEPEEEWWEYPENLMYPNFSKWIGVKDGEAVAYWPDGTVRGPVYPLRDSPWYRLPAIPDAVRIRREAEKRDAVEVV